MHVEELVLVVVVVQRDRPLGARVRRATSPTSRRAIPPRRRARGRPRRAARARGRCRPRSRTAPVLPEACVTGVCSAISVVMSSPRLVNGCRIFICVQYGKCIHYSDGEKLHVLIAGGGLSGLCLAHGLRKHGHTCEVFERDPDFSRKTGYMLHMNAYGGEGLRDLPPGRPLRALPRDLAANPRTPPVDRAAQRARRGEHAAAPRPSERRPAPAHGRSPAHAAPDPARAAGRLVSSREGGDRLRGDVDGRPAAPLRRHQRRRRRPRRRRRDPFGDSQPATARRRSDRCGRRGNRRLRPLAADARGDRRAAAAAARRA